MEIFRTKTLTLRPCHPSEKHDFMDLERDPDVMLYLNGGHPVDQEQGDPDSLFLMPRGTEDYVWTARRTSNGAFVGWFCLWPDSATTAELGYRLRKQDWGQGLASEGAKALVDWGFKECRYENITACTMTVNIGSRRVLEKVGMHLVKTVQVDWAGNIPGGDQGEVIYEINR